MIHVVMNNITNNMQWSNGYVYYNKTKLNLRTRNTQGYSADI